MKKILYLLLFISAISSAQVVTKTGDIYSVVDSKNLTIPDGYISPRSYGAVMDGVTDDRTAFVATLAAAETLSKKIWIDSDIFLDVDALGTKSIFIPSNTFIECGESATIIVNNLLSPAFYIALENNVTFKNVDLVYNNSYDATWGWDSAMHNANLDQLENFLAANKGIVFPSWSPLSRSPIAWRAMFNIQASTNVLFDNVSLISKGQNAEDFILWGFAMREQYAPNQTIAEYDSPSIIPENITFKNLTLDGYIMGIQGVVHGLKTDGVRAYKYTDVQSPDGSNIGGVGVGGGQGDGKWMPPPHLYYINPDSSTDYIAEDIELLNTIDYGEYVGTEAVRGSGGNMASLKLVEGVNDAYIDGYKSYRRDGLGDFGAISNSIIKYIYSENQSDLFPSASGFSNMRFVAGAIVNTVFENITLKDNSDVANIFPINHPASGSNGNKMDGVNLYLKEVNFKGVGPFGFFGSNNKIINSSINIESHTTTDDYAGIVFHDNNTMANGTNNYYDIEIRGWRNLTSTNLNTQVNRLIFSDETNKSKSNYVQVYDVNNNYVIKSDANVITRTFKVLETLDLASGNSVLLDTKIPRYYRLKNIVAQTESTLASGVIGLGSASGLNDYLEGISVDVGIVEFNINESLANDSNDRDIYINTSTDFSSTGEVTLTFTFERVSTESGGGYELIKESKLTIDDVADYIGNKDEVYVESNALAKYKNSNSLSGVGSVLTNVSSIDNTGGGTNSYVVQAASTNLSSSARVDENITLESGKTYQFEIKGRIEVGTEGSKTVAFSGDLVTAPPVIVLTDIWATYTGQFTTDGTSITLNAYTNRTSVGSTSGTVGDAIQLTGLSLIEVKNKGGTTANRPSNPVKYQSYFDETLGYDITFNGTNWVDGSGTIR